MDKRRFIKTLISGGVATVLPGFPMKRSYADLLVTGVNYRLDWRRVLCQPGHALRDGNRFIKPDFSERRDIVIVGAGPVGLCTAWELQQHDVLVLEKESICGGNAQQGSWRGIRYTNGTAYTDLDSPLADFCRDELDLEFTPINSHDTYLINDRLVHDLFGQGLSQLPFNESIRSDFARLLSECQAMATKFEAALDRLDSGQDLQAGSNADEAIRLDAMSLSTWLEERGFSLPVRNWVKLYCPPQVGGYPEDISALVACTTMAWMGDYSADGTLPGGLGQIAESLERGLRENHADRIRTDSFVVQVENSKDEKAVDVTYLAAGELRTVRCKTCLWAAPKHIASRVITDLPAQQQKAMDELQTLDISVMNLCYRKKIHDGAYYTWLHGLPVSNLSPADWVLHHGVSDSDKPQVLSCDWPVRSANRALLLDDAWIVSKCQETAAGMNERFPGSLAQLEEIRVVVRAHSWVVDSPGFLTRVKAILSAPVGRVLIAQSNQETFNQALISGRILARGAEELIG